MTAAEIWRNLYIYHALGGEPVYMVIGIVPNATPTGQQNGVDVVGHGLWPDAQPAESKDLASNVPGSCGHDHVEHVRKVLEGTYAVPFAEWPEDLLVAWDYWSEQWNGK